MVDDSLSMIIKEDEPPWTPQNYDLEFDGPMTLRRALYLSRNIIAIKLGMELGEQAVDQRGDQVRPQHPGAGGALDSHRLGRRDSAGDDRGLHHVRQPRRPDDSQRDSPGGGPQRQDRVAAAGAERGGDGHRATRGS